MAFQLKFKVTEKADSKSFDVEDTTGLYNADTNPTGYGSDDPSPRINEVSTATVAVTLPKKDTAETPIDVYPTLPNTDDTVKNILATDVDNTPASGKFDDGVYKFEYRITGTYTAEKRIVEHTLTGTSGTANIKVNGINYLTTFNTDLTTTADDFVTTHAAALLVAGVVVTAAAGVITLTADVAGVNFTTSAAVNLTGDLDGTMEQTQSNRTAVAFDFSNTIYYSFLANSKCCRDNLLGKLVVEDDCSCKDNKTYDKWKQIDMHIEGVGYQTCCGQRNEAQDTIDVLNKLCSNISCD